MDKSTAAIIALFTAVTALGALSAQEYYAQHAVGGDNLKICTYLDNVRQLNNTVIEWGTVTRGTHTKLLSILNNGTVPYNLTIYITNLPLGWTESWTKNNTVVSPQAWANASFTLAIAKSAVGEYMFGNMMVLAVET